MAAVGIAPLSEHLNVQKRGPVASELRRHGAAKYVGTSDVPIQHLNTLQETYDPGVVSEFAAGTRIAKPPIAVVHQGAVWLENGHHRAVAAKQAGQPLLSGVKIYSDNHPQSAEYLRSLSLRKSEIYASDVRKQPIGACPHGLKIFLVDGSVVRDEHDSDFVQGGNPERYPWVPKGEIWIDETTPPKEVPFVAMHECEEANLMATKGEGYDQAHDEAKEDENKARHHTVRVALVTAYNGQGQLLLGKRNDNQKYTLPGGHLEGNETPEEGAIRELYEETGLRATSLSQLKRDILPNGTELYCFSAYVSGSPHGKNDPDDEVSEWEWIDVEEGLPPKVYDHLAGPPDENNLVKQLFQLAKSEWELVKREKIWHSDDWGNQRVSIPSINHPDRAAYDQNYTNAIKQHYGEGLKPVKLGTDVLDSVNTVHNKSRFDLYRKMFRKEGRLPPLVVRRNAAGRYDILDGNHKYHAAIAEGGGKLHALEVPSEHVDNAAMAKTPRAPRLTKAEDEIYRMLDNPDPIERQMALKLDTVRPEHLFAASLDPDPSVYQPAIDNPLFGPSQALSLMEAVVGKNGTYPADQKRLFLMRHGRVEPYHFSALLRAAQMAGPDRLRATVFEIANHPMAPEGTLRSMYMNPDVLHDARVAIVGHPRAPVDVLDHALQTGATFAAGAAGDIAAKAVQHPLVPYGTLRALVQRAVDRGEPHIVQLAKTALEYNQGLQTPALAEIFKDLVPRVQLRSSAAAPVLLGALLRNPNVSPALADEATRILPPDTLLKSGVMENAAFGPEHLQKMLDTITLGPKVAPTKDFDNIAKHPIIRQQLGFDPSYHKSFRAAKFLSMGAEVSDDAMRSALYLEDGDVDRAALYAYGLPCTTENLAALHAISALSKSDDPILEPTPHAEKVVTAHPEGEDVADMIRRAFKTNFVFPVALGGKHSKGSFIAYDEKTRTTVLLKSGSGGAGGAAGSKQDPSNPNAREAAFWYIAKEWKIEENFPRAEEVIIDERPYAALQLLPLDYKPMDSVEKKEPGSARNILHPYLFDGKIHQWAVIDYVLGNPDRHGQNVMVNEKKEVRLIDHGSAFAGTMFDPAHDNGSFVPYYLRAWALDENFQKIPTETKLKSLPRVPSSVADKLKLWVAAIVPEQLRLICQRYGIDPEPTLARLQKLQVRVANEPVDVVIDQLWVTT